MTAKSRRLLYIDMAYRMQLIQEKRHGQWLEARHSGGYFEKVLAVHPLSDLVGNEGGRIEFIRHSSRQLVVEGVSRGWRLPRLLFPLDFLFSQAGLVRVLARLVRKNDISVITATDPFYGGILSLILKKLTGRPNAVCIYGNYDELYEATGALAMPRLLPFRWLEKLVARTVLAHTDLVIGGNYNNLQYGLNNGARRRTAMVPVSKNAEPAHLVPPADRTGAGEVMQRLNIPQGRPLLLYVGRLIELKHPDDAVRAMAQIIDKHPEAVGLLAGAGKMLPELQRMAADLGMEEKIRFLGHVTQYDLAQILPSAITISPLTGQALIESGLGGSPIVAYDRDWQPEFVKNGVNGYIVPFRDHAALARGAIDLLDDPEKRRRFSQAVRERALEYADREKVFAREREVYEDLISAYEARRPAAAAQRTS